MNPFLIFGPLGAIIVGVLFIAAWKMRSNVSIKHFLFGGLVWGAAIAPKIVMDYTVTPMLSSWAKSAYGIMGMLIILGIYVGLRTGLFECGFAFLAFSRTELRKATWEEAMAFGVGFGAVEAILIGLPSLMQIAVFVLNPSLLESLPPTQREIIESLLNSPTWVAITPTIERTFTLFAHVFATMLIYISVTRQKPSLLLAAILYKTLLDALVPYIQTIIDMNTPITLFEAESWIIAMGLLGLAGTLRLGKTYRQNLRRKNYEFKVLR